MSLKITDTDLHVLNMRARMPLKYGIATLTAVPHLFVGVTLDIDGKRQHGIAADGLPPKWFTKDPNTTFKSDLDDMFAVIRSACRLAELLPAAATPFELWQGLYRAQERWAKDTPHPPLLWNFGVSLVERAMLDAFCRATGQTIAGAVHNNSLGIRLSDIHRAMKDANPADLLPAQPLRSLSVRHCVSMADPLTPADIPASEALNDGLPQSLEDCIRLYELTHFKIKLSGNFEQDRERLHNVAAVLDRMGANYAFTLDANENFRELAPFKELWQSLKSESALKPFLSRLIYIEQPFHRDAALSEPLCAALRNWADRPPMIIDESDGDLASAATAIAGGYSGTSHKNCKGIFKGIANACLIAHRRRTDKSRAYILSAEDLANVGPVALLQDLALVALLGITHPERNGHHYFRGLEAMPAAIQEKTLALHGDLYHRHERGFATLTIEKGAIDVRSVTAAPFGVAFEPDVSALPTLEAWDSRTLLGSD